MATAATGSRWLGSLTNEEDKRTGTFGHFGKRRTRHWLARGQDADGGATVKDAAADDRGDLIDRGSDVNTAGIFRSRGSVVRVGSMRTAVARTWSDFAHKPLLALFWRLAGEHRPASV
jgi:hypothetical protein